MSRVRVAVDIHQPLPVVWDALSELERHSEWMADAESIVFLDEQRSGVGTTMDVLTRVGPLTTIDRIVVQEWTPPTTIAVAHRGLVSGAGAFHLVEIPTGTRFVWEERLRFPWYLGGPVAAVAATPVLTRIWRSNLSTFKATVEESDEPSTTQ